MFNNKSILITGGTGSFGNEFVKQIIQKYKKIKKLIIFSRDELKQHEMSKTFSEEKYKFIRYFLGDVRDEKSGRIEIDRVSGIMRTYKNHNSNKCHQQCKTKFQHILTNIITYLASIIILSFPII